MAAIVRVKRRIEEDPVDSLIVSCKKIKKTQDEDKQSETSFSEKELKGLFKFAVTIPKEEDDIVQHIRNAIRKDKLQKEYKRHNISENTTTKERRRHKLASQQNRYQVVSHRRALEFEGLDARTATERDLKGKKLDYASSSAQKNTEEERRDKGLFCLYDVEINDCVQAAARSDGACGGQEEVVKLPEETNTVTCNAVPMIRERLQRTMPEYVYDLYYMNSPDFDFRALENILAIEANGEDSVYMPVETEEDWEVYEDEDDSNDEGNWRNDYPDEDPHFYESDGDDIDDGYHYSRAFSDDEETSLQNMTRNLNIDDKWSSSEEDDFCTQNHETWKPSANYSDYMAKVMKDLGQNHEEEYED